MCQISVEERNTTIEQSINNHINESKLLNEWYQIINEVLPRSRRLTQRELAHLFLVFRKTNKFSVEHLGHSYIFHQAV